MKIGLVIIGDELLNGHREDKHLKKVIEIARKRQLSIAWVRYVGDDPELLAETFRQTLKSKEIVFSFGGIGATPDDLTRPAIAKAMEVELIRHPDAVACIENQFGDKAYPKRILMAEIPVASTIIPNPVNNIPGFKVEHHHFVPGFPDMAWPMVEWSLNNFYPELKGEKTLIQRWDLIGAHESDLIDPMNQFLKQFPDFKLSSLPESGDRSKIQLSIEGPEEQLKKAINWIKNTFGTLVEKMEEK